MKLKKNITGEWSPENGEFWYDLTRGGYLSPEDYLTKKDAAKVQDAIDVLLDFENLVTSYAEDNCEEE